MTTFQLKILRDAAKILKRYVKKNIRCEDKDWNWGCWECRFQRTVREYESLVHDVLESDEEIEAYMKKYDKMKKKIEKNNPK